MAKNHKGLIKEMECPVCSQYLHPPIRQCTFGHSICDNCYQMLQTCPKCRKPLATTRNFALESLHAKLMFPCKNHVDGCKEVHTGANIRKHEIACDFSICPLNMFQYCRWAGTFDNWMIHCIEQHEEDVFAADEIELTYKNFWDNATPNVSSKLFLCYKNFFAFSCQMDRDEGYIRWCVGALKHDRDDRGFLYQIVIKNQNDSEDFTILTAPCVVYKPEDGELFNSPSSVVCYYDTIKKYCKNENLVYTVKIDKQMNNF